MRDKRLDFFKGILTIQMIFAHCLQFFCDLGQGSVWRYVSDWVNLTTFSGFVFAFGYAYHLAYLQKDFKVVIKKGSKNVLVLLGAYYISAFSYAIFIERLPLRRDCILELLLFQRLAGWSEFLFSFAMMILVTFILWKPLTHKNPKVLLGMGVVALLVGILPHGEVEPIAGSLIGGKGGAYFPVLPFYVYFVAGVYFARKKLTFDVKVLLVSLAGTAYLAIDSLFLSKNYPPSRFPLSFAWLVGAAFILYGYYLVAGYLGRIQWLSVVSLIGKDSLFYLLISNILIFALKNSTFYKIGSGFSIAAFLVIMGIGRYFHRMVENKTCRKG